MRGAEEWVAGSRERLPGPGAGPGPVGREQQGDPQPRGGDGECPGPWEDSGRILHLLDARDIDGFGPRQGVLGLLGLEGTRGVIPPEGGQRDGRSRLRD